MARTSSQKLKLEESGTEGDLVHAILDALKPWRDPPWPRGEIERGVRQSVGVLKENVAQFFSRDATIKTREDARELMETIGKLKKQLGRALLSRELTQRLKLEYRQPFFKDLDFIYAECRDAKAAATQPGGKGRRDQVKEWCARIAHSLVVRYSRHPPSNGSSTSALRHIAGLLYRSVNPQGETPDLRRACAAVLRAAGLTAQIGLQIYSDL